MSKSKHYKWQANWTVDAEKTTAVHQLGLTVMLAGGRRSVIGSADVIGKLSPKHGHNAVEMVNRMIREGTDLLTGRARIYA